MDKRRAVLSSVSTYVPDVWAVLSRDSCVCVAVVTSKRAALELVADRKLNNVTVQHVPNVSGLFD